VEAAVKKVEEEHKTAMEAANKEISDNGGDPKNTDPKDDKTQKPAEPATPAGKEGEPDPEAAKKAEEAKKTADKAAEAKKKADEEVAAAEKALKDNTDDTKKEALQKDLDDKKAAAEEAGKKADDAKKAADEAAKGAQAKPAETNTGKEGETNTKKDGETNTKKDGETNTGKEGETNTKKVEITDQEREACGGYIDYIHDPAELAKHKPENPNAGYKPCKGGKTFKNAKGQTKSREDVQNSKKNYQEKLAKWMAAKKLAAKVGKTDESLAGTGISFQARLEVAELVTEQASVKYTSLRDRMRANIHD